MAKLAAESMNGLMAKAAVQKKNPAKTQGQPS
jgi:hypothetical protein